jgi:hypothetical protein
MKAQYSGIVRNRLLVIASIKIAYNHSRRNAKVETAMVINAAANVVSPNWWQFASRITFFSRIGFACKYY